MSDWTFLVVVPTHRPQVSQHAIDEIKASLTYPSEFVQLDGTPSKVHALNKFLDSVNPAKHRVYVTIDDDILIPENWQHFVACAFDRVPNLGACGVDMAGTEDGETCMLRAMSVHPRRYRDIMFRDTTAVQNIAGACMAMPAKIAKRVGKYPLENDGRQYHIDEDGWRCHRVKTLGYRFGYVTCPNGPLILLQHEDTPEYSERKVADTGRWLRGEVSWRG